MLAEILMVYAESLARDAKEKLPVSSSPFIPLDGALRAPGLLFLIFQKSPYIIGLTDPKSGEGISVPTYPKPEVAEIAAGPN